MDKRPIIIIFLLTALIMLSGCARTVTFRTPEGNRLVASVNLAGPLNITDNKYYMVISDQPNYQLPFSPYEFIEPRFPPADPQIDYYNYYSTWSCYIVVDHGTPYLVNGPFASGESYSLIQVGDLQTGTNISFQIRLDQVFGGVVPDVLYFDLVSSDTTKTLKDHLTPPSKSILTFQGVIVSGSDEGEADIDPSLNFLDWSVTVQ